MPANIIECDGATRLRVDFPLLWDVLDQEYIIDADSFRTPDLRGRLIIGVGTGAGLTTRLLADTGGAEAVTLSVDQLPAHTHSVNESGLNVDVEPPAGVPDAAGGLPLPSTTGSTGGGDPVSIMPPFYALRYGMVAK
jgi:microcystin-dependent protein